MDSTDNISRYEEDNDHNKHNEQNDKDIKKEEEKKFKESKKNKRKNRRKCFKQKLSSLKVTVWIYFAIFIFSIIVLLWIVFGFSLEKTYKYMKTDDILQIARYIVDSWGEEDFTTDTLDKLAYDNDMCIIIEDSYGRTVYSYDVMAKNCLIHGTQSFVNIPSLRTAALESENGVYYTEFENSRFKTNMLVFVMTIGSKDDPSGYVFLNTSLEPLDSTVNIIKSQLFMISAAVLVLGFGISYFLSKLIATPIVRITKSAEKMGQGDYNVDFNGRGYTETEKLAETLNYASVEISKVDSLRRDLIANVSHDLRTPLTIIKSYAEMIRDISGDKPEKRNEHIGVIIEESDRLAALVNDMLDLSKLENKTEKLNLTEFCLNEKIADVMKRYTLISETGGYKFYIGDAPDIIVKADIIKIEQVLYNLINNALNYSGDRKEIYIMQIIRGRKVRVCITDTGPGIEKELMPLIFDRYYRAEKHKREVIGTGLGLSIVKQILISHGFDFGVQSELGVGSTFWFEMDIVSDSFRSEEIEIIN